MSVAHAAANGEIALSGDETKPRAMAFKTQPSARCVFHRPGSTDGFALYADTSGFVRFFLAHTKLTQDASQSDPLVFDCATSSGAILATTAFDATEAAALASTPEVTQQIGLTLRPALSANPSTVTSAELEAGNYPPIPPGNNPGLYNQWLRHVSTPVHLIPAETTEIPGKFSTIVTAISSNWSGLVLQPINDVFLEVLGQWNVPGLIPPPPFNGNYESALWVGLDGTTNQNGLIQAGTEQDEWSSTLYGWWTYGVGYYAWYEYVPDVQHSLSMYVQPGDRMSVGVWAGTKSALDPSGANGTFFIENVTRGSVWYQTLPKPSNGTYQGLSAEWIMERPLVCDWFFGTTCGLPWLSNYGTAEVSGAIAFDIYGQWLSALNSSGYNEQMVSSNNTLSTASESGQSVDFSWVRAY